MIKRFFTTLLALIAFGVICYADIVPLKVSDIPENTIGVYQVSSSKLTVYEKPDENAKVVYEEIIDYSKHLDQIKDDVFCVMLPKKHLSYLYVIDCYDEWVQVIYNKTTKSTGWVKKDDIFQFLPWVNFYEMYGRKYGLIALRNTEKFNGTLHSKPDKNSAIVGQVTHPVRIRLTTIEGNWALVSILDITGNVQTGYLNWRSQDGKYFIFPEFK